MKRVRESLVSGCLLLLCVATASVTLAQDLVINEFMASNDGTLTNATGETHDWIEIYNISTGTIDLTGWHLTDNDGNLDKWTFPTVLLEPQDFLLVYASGSNEAWVAGELHADFQLTAGGEYLALTRPNELIEYEYAPEYPEQSTDVSYGIRPASVAAVLIGVSNVYRYKAPTDASDGTNWVLNMGFDDSAWSTGTGPIGYQTFVSDYDGIINTTVPNLSQTIYQRSHFVLDPSDSYDVLTLCIQYDDGFAVYLNGTKVLVINSSVPDPDFDDPAFGERPNNEGLAIEDFDLSSFAHLFQPGTNTFAVQTLNVFVNPFGSELLMSYALNAQDLQPDISGELRYFHTSTPGAQNLLGEDDFLKPVIFDPERGYYSNAVTLTLSMSIPDFDIWYTLDGPEPTTNNGFQYSSPLAVQTTTVVRAIGFREGFEPSPVMTHTYLFVDDIKTQMPAGTVNHANIGPFFEDSLRGLPTIILSTHDDNLFSAATGIYANPGGRGVAWERPCSIEWINPDNTTGVQLNCGVRIYGGASRGSTKKNFRLLFKGVYGPTKLELDLFPNDPSAVDEFDTIILRNGGFNFYLGSGPYDEFIKRSQLDMWGNAVRQTHAHLFLNDTYWGLYNPTERADQAFGSSYYNVDKDEWDAINSNKLTGESKGDTWSAMSGALYSGMNNIVYYMLLQGKNPDGTRNQAYTVHLDIANKIDYMIANIWPANRDWPGHNWYSGGSRTNSTGWKFWCWDAESSFGGLTVDVSGTGGPNNYHGALKSSPEYRLQFADRVRRHFFDGGVMTPEGVHARYQQLVDEIRPGIVANAARWGSSSTPIHWENSQANTINNYLPYRTAVVLDQLRARDLYPMIDAPEFNVYGGPFSNGFQLVISASNTVYYMQDGTDPRELDSGAIRGLHYQLPLTLTHNVHVKARARSPSGEWSALTEAFFTDAAFSALTCTEIMPQPLPPLDTNTFSAGDFEYIELKNTGLAALNLEYVEFTDGIDFTFPAMTLSAGDYVLVVSDTNAFASRYDTTGMDIAGEFKGSLNDQGERVRLKSWDDGFELSTFEYNDSRSWPIPAQGGGHSLVPDLAFDQTASELDHGANWRASAFRGGSPGEADPDPIRDVLINEIVAHTDYSNAVMPEYDSNDAIELFNVGDGPVTFTNWYLSDDVTEPTKWPIPPTLSLAVSNWLAFDEVSGFHNPITNGFGLNKAGDQAVVSYLPGTDQDRIADAVRFKAQRQGFSWNRYPDGEDAWYELLPTTNAANGVPGSHVIINEIMYHPPEALEAAAGVELQYVELLNLTGSSVMLASEGIGWRMDGGMEYTFTTNDVIPPGGYLLLVDFDPAEGTSLPAFLSAYGVTNVPALVYGPFGGDLSGEGERIALERPEQPDFPGQPVSWVIVDEVNYFDAAGWPQGADGEGTPLQRVDLQGDGNLPASWTDSLAPSPGVPRIKIGLTSPQKEEVFFTPATIEAIATIDENQVVGSVDRVDFIRDGSVAGTDSSFPYSVSLTDLTNAGTFTLSAEIVDDGGTNASGAISIDILSVETLPAGELTDVVAELRGRINGNVPATASFFYGLNDGGTDKHAWDQNGSLGSTAPGIFNAFVGNLDAGMTYHARAQAQEGTREGWAPESISFMTPYFNQWSNRMEITFPGYDDTEVLTKFPALIALSTNIAGFSYIDFQPGATDLRFTLVDGIALHYEIEGWDTNGESTVWVLLPALSTNGPVLYAHWGNPSAMEEPSSAAGSPVWDNEYRAVWHFSENLVDSTGTEIAQAQVVNYGAGVAGQALEFTGSNQVVDLDIYSDWYGDNTDSMTISVWVKPDNSGDGNVYGADDLADQADLFMSSALGQWRYNIASNQSLIHAMAVGDWQMLTLVMDGTQARGYWNDDPVDIIGTHTQFVPAVDLLLGAVNQIGSGEYEGILDEFRLSGTVRSEEWVYACYRTIADNASFTSYQVVDANIPDIDIDGLPDAWERDVLGGEGVSTGTDDTDLDGLDDTGEFTAGTSPTNSMDVFHLYSGSSGGMPDLRFDRIPTAGPYYTNQVRLYALECIEGLISNTWEDLPEATNIPAVAAPFVYTNFTLSTNASRFYRGRVWLQSSVTN